MRAKSIDILCVSTDFSVNRMRNNAVNLPLLYMYVFATYMHISCRISVKGEGRKGGCAIVLV